MHACRCSREGPHHRKTPIVPSVVAMRGPLPYHGNVDLTDLQFSVATRCPRLLCHPAPLHLPWNTRTPRLLALTDLRSSVATQCPRLLCHPAPLHLQLNTRSPRLPTLQVFGTGHNSEA